MKIYTKAFLAGIFTVAVMNGASAQVRIGVYAGDSQPYYPPTLQAQPIYVAPPSYYQDQNDDLLPDWRARQEWRKRQERQWQRAEWQRQQEWHRQEDWDRHAEWHQEREHEHDARRYGQD